MDKSPKRELLRFLAEDLGRGDITSKLLSNKKIKVRIFSREDGIVAGVKYAKQIFELKKSTVRVLKNDGSRIKKNQTVIEIIGNPKSILSCERTALNILSRMSGIATKTNRFLKLIRVQNHKIKLFSTRKTAPGLRFFDKEAVKIGGGERHRMKLDEMILIKDNHIAVSGSLKNLILNAKKKYKKIEVEVENQHDAILAAKEGVNIIMLDNLSPKEIEGIVRKLKKLGLRSKVKLEASGGINEKNISSFARTGVDMISVGKITSSPVGIDYSLEVIQ